MPVPSLYIFESVTVLCRPGFCMFVYDDEIVIVYFVLQQKAGLIQMIHTAFHRVLMSSALFIQQYREFM